MNKDWIKITSKITDNMNETQQIKCPSCGKKRIDYIYVGDEKSRIGYLQIWCNECLKGVYISRVVAPSNVKFVTFDANLKEIVPKYEFIED